MAARSDHQIMRLGAICLVVLLLALAAAFNLQKFPGFAGTTYRAEFTDASGLRDGSIVQIAGMRVGRVHDITIGRQRVIVEFDVKDAEIGRDTEASVEVLNLLGEKYLQITPKGPGVLAEGSTIPLSRTDTSYDIVGTLATLTTTTERINTGEVTRALSTLGDTLQAAAPQVQSSFTGISRLSQTIASRDTEITRLLHRADSVTALLEQRRGDLVVLMKQADLLFKELRQRRQAIHSLLVNTRRLADSLRGVAEDNRRQIGPVLEQLNQTTMFLNERRRQLALMIHRLAPYASILGNIIGTGPWFDNWVVNLGAVGSGEFVPGPRR